MTGGIIIIGILLFFLILGAIVSVIDSVKKKRTETGMAKQLGPLLDNVLNTVNATDIRDLERQAEVLRKDFASESIILEDDEGRVVNICPNCGDTLNVKDTGWYGRILGCPNYPCCRHLVKINDMKDGVFKKIQVRGSD